MIDHLLQSIGKAVARFLSKPISSYAPPATIPSSQLAATIRPGDVLLLEGHSRLSVAIKYLTQSTWSHAAFYIGNAARLHTGSDLPMLIEVDVQTGVRLVPLSAYEHEHTRICRPFMISTEDLEHMIEESLARIGQEYDLRNVFDLARYLFPAPPIPARWKRRMIALGAGDPTKAICSSMIAQLFQDIHYPILPDVRHLPDDTPGRSSYDKDMLHIRNSGLYTPRDFDISPYFQIVKPDRPIDFNYHLLRWDN